MASWWWAEHFSNCNCIRSGEGAPTNLIGEAKEVIMSLVKNVLSPGDKEKDTADVPQEVQDVNPDSAANSSARNVTGAAGDGEEKKKDTLLPCPPDVQ